MPPVNLPYGRYHALMTSFESLRERLGEVLRGRAERMQGELAEHVAIPTGHNHRPGLDAYRAIVRGRLEALGASSELVPGEPRPAWISPGTIDRAEAAAREVPPTLVCRRDGAGLRVHIAGHLDTVFPPGGPFCEMRVAGDGLTAVGPGVVDMKGGVLIALHALEALAEVGVETRWTFTLNSDEETGTYHSDRALREVASAHDVGIALEPALPDGSLAIERKGSGQFLIETVGRSAHAGREFEKGVSAVYALARELTAVEGMSDVGAGTTVNVGPVEGGVATNVVPDRARAWGNARFVGEAESAALGARLDGLAREAGERSAGVLVRRSFNRPAKPRTSSVEWLAMVAREEAESIGQRLPFSATGGVCDGNNMQAAGLPTIDTMGVRGGGLHTHDEWIELASLAERGQLLGCVLARLGSMEAGAIGG